MQILQQYYEKITVILIFQVNNWGLETLYKLSNFVQPSTLQLRFRSRNPDSAFQVLNQYALQSPIMLFCAAFDPTSINTNVGRK